MKNQQRELVFLRSFAVTVGLGILAFLSYSFKSGNPFNQKFGTIDVERINIIEKDGTVKMVITNADHFPTKGDAINGRINHKRKKRAGMLFFNEDGMECGGFIYDGAKNEQGHSAGLSLTYDQFDGDQVMQLLSTDKKVNGKRYKSNLLVFNDQGDHVTQQGNNTLQNEIKAIKDPKLRKAKYEEYKKKGLLSTHTPRVALGNFVNNKGLYLFDDNGKPRALFCIDENNKVKLETYDEKGNVLNSWPTK
ncbi:conserved protein of unknown function [Tenacibaculum sp. 190130A14a]|uniref:Uncharacterized protein n=1 Tax=Tenacibaculum polynesiense TaxID=3137857 RepID=A0ABP1F2D8_9FLAO